MHDIDADLTARSRDELLAEVRRLRAAIRTHRDSTQNGLCWHHPQLWNLLPEASSIAIRVASWPQFLRGCIAYRTSLDDQLPDAPRTDAEYSGPGT